MIQRFIMKVWMLLAVSTMASLALSSLPPLRVQGMKLVDPTGKALTLKGTNVGNWLVIEMWMLGLSDVPGAPEDQFSLEKLLTERFGEAEKDRLLDVHRSSWITGADFKLMRTFGFNVVRLPMNYRLMEDDRRPFKLKASAWKWIDRAIDMAEAAGLYTILDMHGVQGGQSPYDHTGHSNQNRLKDDPAAQKRLAWLWGEIAKRYRQRSAVLAYDVFNEPYGTPKPIQVSVFKRALAEIRKRDADKLVIASGNYDDFGHYGDPKVNGWRNVGFQMHYYPGMFGGGPPTVPTHVRHLEFLKTLASRVKKLNVPFLIGEMNVVFDSAGGADMMRRYFETHAKYGWITTMWSWKVVSKEGGIQPATWGAVVNRNPMRKIDFRTATVREIEAYFRGFAKEPLAIHEKLRKALTSKSPLAPLPPLPPMRTSAPQHALEGWKRGEIGSSMKGGLRETGKDQFELFGGGKDVWGTEDQATFLYREIEGDFEIEVTVDSIENIDTYTKAGLMVRSGLAPGAATVLFSSFPNGELQLAHRAKAGGEMQGTSAQAAKLPGLRLRLQRTGDRFEAFWDERSVGSVIVRLPNHVFVGVLALSHDAAQLARFVYRNLRIRSLRP